MKPNNLDQQFELAVAARPDIERMFVERARESLLHFTVYSKPDYELNWHHVKMAKKLEAFERGEIKRLMFFMPPRHGKTEICSKRFPAWVFGRNPNKQIIACSYGQTLADKNSRDIQRIMDAQEYTRIFPQTKLGNQKTQDSSTKTKKTQSEFEIAGHRGAYRAAGVGGTVTGTGADILIIDDPVKNQEEAESETFRNKVYDWFISTADSRLEKNGQILLVMTLWHDDDLAGRILEQSKKPGARKWDVVKFEALRTSAPNPDDPRQEGQALWRNKYDEKELNTKRIEVGSRVWSSLYQQSPTPRDGGLFKRKWWQYYSAHPANIKRIVQFWDCAQKPGVTNDYSVCATWAETPTGLYVLDVWRDKVEAPDLESACQSLFNKWKPSAVVIEDKSAGSSLIQNMRRKTKIPVIAYNPGQKSKEIRAIAATPMVESGNVFLLRSGAWVEDFVVEHERFPLGQHDDQVDTTSMAVDHFGQTKKHKYSVRV